MKQISQKVKRMLSKSHSPMALNTTISAKLYTLSIKANKQTCASLNLMSGQDKSPVISCSMYSNTRYMLHDNLEVIRPSNFMIFGWSSLLKIRISLAINRTLSGSKLSNRTFFKATIFPVSRSRARNTLLYVPCPIC